MYTALARFGYGIATKLRPSKVKSLIQPMYDKATKKAVTGKMSATEDKFIRGLQGAAKKGYKGYTKAYEATLGTSTRRKVTSGVLGGYTLGSIFDDE
jgi:hypothetical protein